MKTIFFLFFICLSAFAATETQDADTKAQGKIHYRSGKEINFGATTVNGNLQRPDIAVVTGNEADKNNGLLRLRENFVDRIASDFAEEVQ